MAKRRETAFSAELLDELLEGQSAATVLRSDGLVGELKKALAERMLNAEMEVHLEGETEQEAGNHRNGSSQKTVLSGDGGWLLSIPRDRHGRFEPALIRKNQRRFPGFDDKIIALYARGMSTGDIQAHVGELYGVAISPDLISGVTDPVIDEVGAWQSRPLEETYAIVYFDALGVKLRDEGLVRNKAVYLTIGVRCSGHKEVLGLWIEETEGAKFWMRVMTDFKVRGIQDCPTSIEIPARIASFTNVIERPVKRESSSRRRGCGKVGNSSSFPRSRGDRLFHSPRRPQMLKAGRTRSSSSHSPSKVSRI